MNRLAQDLGQAYHQLLGSFLVGSKAGGGKIRNFNQDRCEVILRSNLRKYPKALKLNTTFQWFEKKPSLKYLVLRLLEQLPGRDERLYREYWLEVIRGQLENGPIKDALVRLLKCGLVTTLQAERLHGFLRLMETRRVAEPNWLNLTWGKNSPIQKSSHIYRCHLQMFRSYEMAIHEGEKTGSLPNSWVEFGHGHGQCQLTVCKQDVSDFPRRILYYLLPFL